MTCLAARRLGRPQVIPNHSLRNAIEEYMVSVKVQEKERENDANFS